MNQKRHRTNLIDMIKNSFSRENQTNNPTLTISAVDIDEEINK